MAPRNRSDNPVKVSIFGMPAGWRLAVAGIIVVVLWLGVAWALR